MSGHCHEILDSSQCLGNWGGAMSFPLNRTGDDAMTTAWHDLQHEPISWEMFFDIDESVRRDLEIVDGYVSP
jgi:hypothetical protein